MNNFCQDCGKRNLFDLIHACTPPEGLADAGQAMAVDAARYRWLKAHHDADFCFSIVKNPHCDCYESGELDAAIDAAMKEPK